MLREKKIIHIGKNLISAFAAGTRHELTLMNMTEKTSFSMRCTQIR